ncbi:hypothetical protein ACGF0J_13770 [Nonomuraea sp. NPDC047897]|uniref:hypothetical protein n=1 Tax=Nonomuraea sp. NPDC047897 TaxID=3364346 RepID=UPI003710F08A
MTPRHAPPPDEHEQPRRKAAQLAIMLAARHNIPAIVQTVPCGVVVRVYAGLVAHVEHDVIWWNIPDVTGTRQRPLTTYAHTTEGAANRLAQHYDELLSVPIAELLRSGRIRLLTDKLLDDVEVHRAAL